MKDLMTSRTMRNYPSTNPIVIPGKFDTLNEFIKKNRQGYIAGNAMKKRDQNIICRYIPKGIRYEYIDIVFRFFEPNTKRDKDNISSYFHKIFFDALVQVGCIQSDGWRHIGDITDKFYVDKHDPRIEVEIIEVER